LFYSHNQTALKTSIIFPAFVSEYSGFEEPVLTTFENDFFKRLKFASDTIDQDLTGFDFKNNNFLNDELKSQYISYLFSSSVSDILKAKKINSSLVSGYSMGIYAALYYCGSVTFTDGLKLVKYAWDVISAAAKNGGYGMGMIIGLEESDLMKLIGKNKVEICNQNNRHTFIISGLADGVERVLASARNEGAMRANVIPVSKPYHSNFLKDTASEFSSLIEMISFRSPDNKYVSSIDQNIIVTPDELRKEVIRNLSCRMNWLETMNYMIGQGTDIFFECGAGDGLTRNARFIDGIFKSFSVSKLDKFLDASGV
jgi:malonyl CoA-acyl carrier protein transacylase